MLAWRRGKRIALRAAFMAYADEQNVATSFQSGKTSAALAAAAAAHYIIRNGARERVSKCIWWEECPAREGPNTYADLR